MAKGGMKTIAIANQKGGVAKTTTVVNLAAELAHQGLRVLVIDFDPQRSATSSVFGNVEFELTSHDLLFASVAAESLTHNSRDFGFDVIPADIILSSAELRLASVIGRERILANGIARLKKKYDICLIDTPPTLGLLSVCALVAADYVIIPVCPDYFSLKGIQLVEETIGSVRKNLGSPLSILGVLVTRTKKRVIVASAMKAIVEYFGDSVFKTTIPEDIRVEEAHNAHRPLCLYAPKCKAAGAYRELADEVAKCLKVRAKASRRRKDTK